MKLAIRFIILTSLVSLLLAGCGTKEYYNRQPERDQAEAQRVKQAAAGYTAIAEAVFGAKEKPLPPFTLPEPSVSGRVVAEGDQDGEVVGWIEEGDDAQGSDAATLLLQYIVTQQQAAERTNQVRALVDGYTKAILKAPQQQKGPFDPTGVLVEAIRQTPLGLAVRGLQNVGQAGVAGAQGDSTTSTTSTVTTETHGAE